jgi:hypothetical protein
MMDNHAFKGADRNAATHTGVASCVTTADEIVCHLSKFEGLPGDFAITLRQGA